MTAGLARVGSGAPHDGRGLDERLGVVFVVRLVALGGEALVGEPALAAVGDAYDEVGDLLILGSARAVPPERIAGRALGVQAVEREDVEVQVQVQGAAEALEHGDAAAATVRQAAVHTRSPLPSPDLGQGALQHPTRQLGAAREQPTSGPGDREHPLAHRDPRQDLFDPPRADVWVEVSTGVNQHLVPCNDAIHGGIETHRTYTPLSGSATLTVTPTDKTWTEWEMPADATVVLENVEFEDDSGDTVTLPTLTITHYVGWLPG